MCVFGIAALLIGCDDEESPPPDIREPPPPNYGDYKEPTAPESLINNLQVSYRRREIEKYAQILAPEFRFRFQPIDQNEIGKEFWTHDEDSVGTRALLTTPRGRRDSHFASLFGPGHHAELPRHPDR